MNRVKLRIASPLFYLPLSTKGRCFQSLPHRPNEVLQVNPKSPKGATCDRASEMADREASLSRVKHQRGSSVVSSRVREDFSFHPQIHTFR